CPVAGAGHGLRRMGLSPLRHKGCRSAYALWVTKSRKAFLGHDNLRRSEVALRIRGVCPPQRTPESWKRHPIGGAPSLWRTTLLLSPHLPGIPYFSMILKNRLRFSDTVGV